MEHKIAKASGMNLPISFKFSIEMGNFIRGKDISRVRILLNGVIEQKVAVPYKRFNKDRGHKTKMGPGGYPKNVAKAVLRLVESCVKNAKDLGLDESKLYLKTFTANKGSGEWHYGRHLGRKRKRTHIYLEVAEKENKKEKAGNKK